MIAVDIFADLFEWSDQDRTRGHRAMGTAKGIFAASRGKMVAGPTAYVDAVLSALDMIGAYARYRQATEITTQLVVEGDMLRQLLAELHEQLRIELRVVDLKFSSKLEALRMRLHQKSLTLELDERKLNDLSLQVKKLGKLIAPQRMGAPPHCVALARLEDAYYRLVDLQLQTAMNFIQE